jgi:hypothetical protein
LDQGAQAGILIARPVAQRGAMVISAR